MFFSPFTSTGRALGNASTRVHNCAQHVSSSKEDATKYECNGDDDNTVNTTARYNSSHDGPKSKRQPQQEKQSYFSLFFSLFTRSFERGQAFYQMAEIRADANDWEIALRLYKKALSLQLESFDFDHLRVADHLCIAQTVHRIGKALHRVGRYKESLMVLEKALEIYRDGFDFGENHVDIMDLKHDIWSVCLSMKKERRESKEQIMENKLKESVDIKRMSGIITAKETPIKEFSARAC